MNNTSIKNLIKFHKYQTTHANFLLGKISNISKKWFYRSFISLLMLTGFLSVFLLVNNANVFIAISPVAISIFSLVITIRILSNAKSNFLGVDRSNLEQQRLKELKKYLEDESLEKISTIKFILKNIDVGKEYKPASTIGIALILLIITYFSDTILKWLMVSTELYCDWPNREFWILLHTNVLVIAGAIIFKLLDMFRVLCLNFDYLVVSELKEMLVEIVLDREKLKQ